MEYCFSTSSIEKYIHCNFIRFFSLRFEIAKIVKSYMNQIIRKLSLLHPTAFQPKNKCNFLRHVFFIITNSNGEEVHKPEAVNDFNSVYRFSGKREMIYQKLTNCIYSHQTLNTTVCNLQPKQCFYFFHKNYKN